VIGSNMVLQRNQPVPIWGWCQPGLVVEVKFAQQVYTTQADLAGSWKVTLNKLDASNEPQELLISAGNTVLKLVNILVGEVWLCSGQSNMEYHMKRIGSLTAPQTGVDSAGLELGNVNPNVRLFKVERKLSLPDVTTTGWNECKGAAMEQISAVGYYFARDLQRKLNVPVGLICSAWSGSRIESWTPPSAYESLPPMVQEATRKSLLADSIIPGAYYKSMIMPLAPFAIKGFLWYQGEANCMPNEPEMSYAYKMQALIGSWRGQWNNDKLPFYSVLIAPYYYSKRKKPAPYSREILPEFWEQQIQSTQIPNTEVITITDLVDDLTNIHPSYKWEVGRRLSLVALNKDYGFKKIVYSGPVYTKMEIDGDKIILYFKNGTGLKTSDGKPPSFFTIASADRRFVEARAEIKGQTIVLQNPEIKSPRNVRFAWTEIARSNLFNDANLPAMPFRTDGIEWEYKK
jgi:sialate O-acetylesterase